MESENIEEDLRRLEELSKDSAVGDTMYEKRSVIEKILSVGKHFQQTSYIRDGEVLELETEVEEMLCTLWDISVEEDVSKFFLEHGVLDIFVELFQNPNNRVKEISVGIMSNMVYHQSVFLTIMERDKYLESCCKLLDEKDSPTLLVVLRCFHSYCFNFFNMLVSDEFVRKKEDIKNVLNRFLVYLSLERIVQNIGLIIASCTNKEVLLNASKFLSIFSELWEECEERSKIAQFYADEQFLLCLLEAMKESMGEDKTEKHFAVFLNIVYENDADKDIFASLSDRVMAISSRLLKEHVLQYQKIEETDLEFIFNLVFLIKVSLDSGGFHELPARLVHHLRSVQFRVQKSEDIDQSSVNVSSVNRVITSSLSILETVSGDQENGDNDEDDSCSTTSQSSTTNSPSTRTPVQTFDTPQSQFNTPLSTNTFHTPTPKNSFNTPR